MKGKGRGGGERVGVFWLSQYNLPNPSIRLIPYCSIDLHHWQSIFFGPTFKLRCYGSYKDFQNQELFNDCAKGPKATWFVFFQVPSLILSSFQMIILLSSDPDKRGWDPAYPAFSCKEILRSGHSKGDGEYWIDPEKSGNPLKVYCDMSRYGGEWLRHEDFNRSIFDYDFAMGTFWSWLFVLSLQRSLLCFFNRNYNKIIELDWLSPAGRFEN